MLAIKNISKVFNPGTPDEVRALEGIDLMVEEGSWVVVIGTNGSGKSTLLNAVAGTFLVDSGEIYLENQNVTHWPEHRRAKFIGRVFQNPFSGTAPNMFIAENFALAARRGLARGLGWALRRDLMNELRATWLRPKLLLLDEHTAALDPKNADLVIRLTKEIISSEKLTTLMVTHSMHQAANLGHRLIMMHRGRMIADFSGVEKQRLRANDLLARFEDVRRREQLDPSAAEMLRRTFV